MHICIFVNLNWISTTYSFANKKMWKNVFITCPDWKKIHKFGVRVFFYALIDIDLELKNFIVLYATLMDDICKNSRTIFFNQAGQNMFLLKRRKYIFFPSLGSYVYYSRLNISEKRFFRRQFIWTLLLKEETDSIVLNIKLILFI